MIMKDLEGIVFDLDGTLIDTVRIHAASWVKAFEANGFNAKVEEIEPLIGLGGKSLVRDLLGEKGLNFLLSITNHKNRAYLELIEHAKLFPKVKETLCKLKENGFKLALASSTVSNVLSKVLERFRLKELFDSIVSGDEVVKGKPNAEIFLKAFEKIGVDPTRGAIIGDTQYDILPATRIGATSVIVLHGRKLLKLSVKPDYTINELPELLEIFKRIHS